MSWIPTYDHTSVVQDWESPDNVMDFWFLHPTFSHLIGQILEHSKNGRVEHMVKCSCYSPICDHISATFPFEQGLE